jgi:hypothetical protein
VSAGGHLIEHDAHGEDVGAPVDRFPQQVLGRHVRKLTFDLSRLGLRRNAVHGLGDAEVQELYRSRRTDEDVVRRDVAVHETERNAVLVAKLVRGVQPLASLPDQIDRDRQWDTVARSSGPHDRLQRFTVHPLHDDVERPALFTEIQRFDHVRMVDLRGKRRFLQKHPLRIFVVDHPSQNGLHGDDFLEPSRAALARCPNLSHPTSGNWQQELVAPEYLPDLEACAHRSFPRVREAAQFPSAPPMAARYPALKMNTTLIIYQPGGNRSMRHSEV